MVPGGVPNTPVHEIPGFGDMIFINDQGRQEPKNVGARRGDNHAHLNSLSDQGPCFNSAFNANHQTKTADIADNFGVFFLKVMKAGK